MKKFSNSTAFVSKEDAVRNWWIIDATDKTLGRISTQIATLLRGKHKPDFTPNQDHGDFVIVINTDKVKMTGNKADDKKYYRHSRFFGSMKEKTATQMMKEDSTFVLHEAVRGMLPTNKLSYSLITKLKLFTGPDHPHATQKPQTYNLPN